MPHQKAGEVLLAELYQLGTRPPELTAEQRLTHHRMFSYGKTAWQLVAATGYSLSHVQNTLKKLVDSGQVIVMRDPADGRSARYLRAAAAEEYERSAS